MNASQAGVGAIGSKTRRVPLEVDPATSARLARIRQHGTKPELIVRTILKQLGIRYRTANRSLPGSPDLANRTRRWAIFVNGCFWHHHKGCRRATTPKRNRQFWTEKFHLNRIRDAKAVRALRHRGFQVLLLWECETLDQHVLAARIDRALRIKTPTCSQAK